MDEITFQTQNLKLSQAGNMVVFETVSVHYTNIMRRISPKFQDVCEADENCLIEEPSHEVRGEPASIRP